MKNYVVKTNVLGDSPMPYLGTEFRQAVRKAVHKLKHKQNYRMKVYDMAANLVYEYIIFYENGKWIADKKMIFSIKNENKEREILLKGIQSVDSELKCPDYLWLYNYVVPSDYKKVMQNVRKEKTN